MLYQIQWKKLLTAFTISGLASTVNVKIPENHQSINLFAIEARANPQIASTGGGNSSPQLLARSQERTRSEDSSREQPARTRSSRQNSKIGRSKPFQTRSNGKNSDTQRNEPARTRSSRSLSNPAFRGNQAPSRSNSKKNSPHYRDITLPKIQIPRTNPPNPHQTEFAPPPLPKVSKQKKSSYELPKSRRDLVPRALRDRNVARPKAVALPETVQKQFRTQEPLSPLEVGGGAIATSPKNPWVKGATRFLQILAISSLGIPLLFGLLKLKQAKLPSSSDS
ncbi:MAG: hypothetical protein SW833_13765 [Cyanobacteriota bacterium]|nr:hypothetical protein [Cyanobacteriota bacterium]